MREILKIPVLAASLRRSHILLGLLVFPAFLISTSGCKIKTTIKTVVPPKILTAKKATFEELLGILKKYDQIRDLASNGLKIRLTYGRMESGELEKFREGSGYILLQRPDSARLVILAPITKLTVLDVLSVGNELKVWIPSRNKVYVGDNRAKEWVTEDSSTPIPIRGTHIFEAILPQSIRMDAPEIRISMEEAIDTSAKYYVISTYKEGIAPRIYTIRRIWIERSTLSIARQQFYQEDGQLVSDIEYPEMEQIGEFSLPLKIAIDRPLDGYRLDLAFKTKSWRINSGLDDNAFIMQPHEGAETVHLNEKVQ